MKLNPIECPSCGAKLKIQPGSDYIECRSCGGVFYLDNGKTELTFTKNINIKKETSHTERYIDEAEVIKARTKAKGDKSFSIYVLSIFLPILLLCVMALVEQYKSNTAKSNGLISAGYYSDYVDKDYEAAEANLKGAGFTNIELIDLDDSGVLVWKNEKVESVSIGGNMRFTDMDFFSPDAKVVITYH